MSTKLSYDNILDVLVPVPSETTRQAIAAKTTTWAESIRRAFTKGSESEAPRSGSPS